MKTEAFAEIESESTQLAVTRTPERASLCANIFSWSTIYDDTAHSAHYHLSRIARASARVYALKHAPNRVIFTESDIRFFSEEGQNQIY